MMRRTFVAVTLASAVIVLGAPGADAQVRNGYGTGGYGTGGYGSSGSQKAPSFTAPAPTTPTTGNTGTPDGGGSDYDQAMKSVDSNTSQAFGPPKPDDEVDQDQAAQDIANQAANPYTANPTIGGGGAMANGQPSIGQPSIGQPSIGQPSMGTLPNAAGGYNGQLGNQFAGTGGAAGGASGPFTTATGTTGLGQYNSSPYEKGLGAAGQAPAGSSTSVGAAPAYTGQ